MTFCCNFFDREGWAKCGFNDNMDLFGWGVEENDEGLDVSENHA